MLDFMWIVVGFSFFIGAIFGSFITALVYRTRHQRSMNEKHSVCPHCQHHLSWLDLFPIFSFIGLRGKCRYCHKAISWQYVSTELATALLFSFSTWVIFNHALSHLLIFGDVAHWLWISLSLVVIWSAMVLLVALFMYDLRWNELPNHWTLGGSLLLASATFAAVIWGQPLLWQPTNPVVSVSVVWQTFASGLVAATFFLSIVIGSVKLLHKEGMGMGDVKLALLMGLFLGFPGIVVALYLAFILGSVISLLLIAGKRAKFGHAIPFGPFLVLGTIIALWVTPTVIDWYNRVWL